MPTSSNQFKIWINHYFQRITAPYPPGNIQNLLRHSFAMAATTEGVGTMSPVWDYTEHMQIYSSITRIYHGYRKCAITSTILPFPTTKDFPKCRTNSRNFAIQLNLLRIS